jgi:hypothetical protein
MIHLAPEASKLICCTSIGQCARMTAHLQSLEIDSSCVRSGRSPEKRRTVWNPFILGERPACVGTEGALGGLPTLGPGLKADTEFPVNDDVERHHGDVLYFFPDDRELAVLRALRVFPEIVGSLEWGGKREKTRLGNQNTNHEVKMPLSDREKQQTERENRMEKAKRKGTGKGKSIYKANSPEIEKEKEKR